MLRRKINQKKYFNKIIPYQCYEYFIVYGAETTREDGKGVQRIQTFINKILLRCLRKILGMFWPEKISNEKLR